MVSPGLDEALERAHIDPANYDTIREYQDAVREWLGLTRYRSAEQREAFSEAYRILKYETLKKEVVTVYFEWPAGKHRIRYVLPGRRGLFGWMRMGQWLEEAASR